MSRTSAAILPILVSVSAASADTFTLNTNQLGLLPGAHLLHAQCHAPDWYKDSTCKAIRDKEQADGDAYAKSNATDVFVYDQHRSGRRELYDQTKVKGATSDAGFLAGAALRRYVPTTILGASSQPDFDNTLKPLIDSCDEYVYKRFYAVNRYLDTIGGLLAARRYSDAVGVILNGIPGPLQAPGIQPKACAPLLGSRLVDYDGKAIAPFSFWSEPPAYDVFAPKWTGTRPKNEFYALPELFAPPPAGTIDPYHTAAYWNDYTAAYNASQLNAYRNDGADGEFARARWARTDLVNRTTTAAEADDIAARRLSMRRATATVANKYARCLMKRFRDITATANLGPGTWKSLEQYAADPQEGWTYPVDLDELALEAQLVTSSKALTALSTTLSADTKSLYQSGAWARSRTGSLLRALDRIDSTALATAVSGTASTIKSFNVTTECNLGEEFDAVRDLVVAEWRQPNHGCYSGTSRCDFSDKIFANDIKERLQAIALQEDDVKHACTSTTSDDWVDGTATVDPVNRGSVATFESYLKVRRQQLQEILRNTPHNSTLAGSIGDVRGGGSDWGNGTFGAGYSYRGEWAVNVSSKGTTLNADKETVSCSILGGRVDGQLNAYATGFGYRKNLIDAGLTAKTAQPNQPATLSAHANILGSDLFTPIENVALKPNYTDDDENTQSFTLATAYVAVGPFPVKVSVEVGFDWGYHMKFGYTQSECLQKPTLAVTGELAPYAGTNASVSAGIDLFIVGAGVRFTLTLVSASLPFDASVTVGQSGTDWSVTAKSNLALDLTELAGKVTLFITTFGATVMEFELFSWPGLHQHFDLWHDEAVFPFSGFSLLD